MSEQVLPLLEECEVKGSVARYEVVEWRDRYGLVAGVTARTRAGGLDMTIPASGAPPERPWMDLLRELGPGFDSVAVGRQCHGTDVKRHAEGSSGMRVSAATDGHLTCTHGILLAATIADCVPVYLAHPPSGWVELLHAGWRGIAGGILEKGISSICGASSASAASIVMHCGVSICGSCYEVGDEVLREVLGPAGCAPAVRTIDLRSVLVARARSLGVAQITTSTWCTAHHRDRFYSHRGSGGIDGRMAAYLGRPGIQGRPG